MTLDLYFARRFLRSFLAVGGAFFLLLALIDLVELLRKLTDTSTSLAARLHKSARPINKNGVVERNYRKVQEAPPKQATPKPPRHG